MDVNTALSQLQGVARAPDDPSIRRAGSRQLPPDLIKEDLVTFVYSEVDEDAVDQAVAVIVADLRFEHLAKLKDAVWDFFIRSWAEPAIRVADFVSWHARDVRTEICYIPIEYLEVTSVLTVGRVRLLPPAHDEVPEEKSGWLISSPALGAVAGVETTGTDYRKMADRARASANHELKLLRLAIGRTDRFDDSQLRFVLGPGYAFTERHVGWARRADVAYPLTLNPATLAELVASDLWSIPEHPATDVDKKAVTAAGWIEQAIVTANRLNGLLFLFFALEALLGDHAQGLKADMIAFRQALLAHIVRGQFPHPNSTWHLYANVRSYAVHGRDAPEVTEKQFDRFASDVRECLTDYLALTRQHGFQRRTKLFRYLNGHAGRDELINWIRAHGGSDWNVYFATLDPPPGSGNEVSPATS
jgi:hypothetical protein